ncbi:hypothetical protein ASA1KI_31000 [Opitutales bacterium ASA1]|uniref:right-handed parallel beta-helix repeat-containing protein n=1 Tax=Congregicoccus parvus TaxID=3081749 RepID=UPI002B2FBADB|nr:hypothetical protein ASA1KI_31000 [Opitutales bacterium ASA1]
MRHSFACFVLACAGVAGAPFSLATPLVLEVVPEAGRSVLHEARDRLRELRRSGALPEGAVVRLAPGNYTMEESLVLTAEDSGAPERPIRWVAAAPRAATLSGGRMVADLAPVQDEALLSRLVQEARARVLLADLRAQGIPTSTPVAQRGNPGLEVFYRGRRMPMSAYPNEGWLRIADVPQDGPERLHEGLEREKRYDGVPAGRHYGRITYPDDRPAGWSVDNDVLLHGYWTWDWNDSFQTVAAIDPASREITLAPPHHHYGYTRGQRFRFLGVVEEIDAPGEWSLDRASGRLLFLPPGPCHPGDVVVSVLAEPLIRLDGASHIEIEGLVFEHSRGSGIVVSGGASCRVLGSVFRNLGGEAITIDGGHAHELVSCDLHDLASGAVRVVGGDRATLESSGHRVFNNHIHHFSRWLRTGQYGIMIDGVGHHIAHNLVHDAPFEAMYLRGNDHLIEFNEVHRVCLETGDAGALHTGRDYTWRGNVIRWNYWHDLQGAGLHGVTAVYLDDFSSGFTVHGNVFHRAGRAVQIGGGRDNVVTNNLFVACEPAIHLDARGLGWASYYFDGTYPWLFERFAERGGDSPPYSDRYPPLRKLLADDPAVPKGNVIARNISWGGRWCDLYDFHAYDFHGVGTMRDNWIADRDFVRRRAVRESGWDPYYLDIAAREGYRTWRSGEAETRAEFAGNHIVDTPPGAFDPATARFSPAQDAPLAALGFEPLPTDRMGLRLDAWRTSIPPRVVTEE